MIPSLTNKNIERNLSCARMCVECLRPEQFLQLIKLPQSLCKTKFAHIRPKNFGLFWRCLIIINPQLFFTSYSMTSLHIYALERPANEYLLAFENSMTSVMSVCLPVKISLVDRQFTFLYGNATTSLINFTQICM